jgi:hypothetical protein
MAKKPSNQALKDSRQSLYMLYRSIDGAPVHDDRGFPSKSA